MGNLLVISALLITLAIVLAIAFRWNKNHVRKIKTADAKKLFAHEHIDEIIKALGVTEIELLTNNPEKLTAFAGTGISYKGLSLQVKANKFNKEYLRTKRDLLSHSLGEI